MAGVNPRVRSRVGRRLGVALAVLSLTAVGRDALADPAAAEAFFSSGVHLYDQKSYAKAAEAFGRAYAEEPEAKFLWNLAVAELKAGATWSALRHLRAYKAAPDATSAHLQSIDALIDSARAHAGHLTVDAPSGYAVSVDGAPVGIAPLPAPVDVEPDVDHEVSAERGASHLTTHTKVAAAQTASVELTPPPAASATAPVPAPPAPSPTTTSPAPTSTPAQDDVGANAAPSRSGSYATRNIVVLSTAGAALVAAGIGVTFALVVVNNDANTANEDLGAVDQRAAQANVPSTSACAATPMSPSCAKLQSDLQKWQSDRNIGIGMYVTAGVLAAGALAAFVLWPKPRTMEGAWIVPQIGPGVAGLDVGAHF